MIRNAHAIAPACALQDSTFLLAVQSRMAAGDGVVHPGEGDAASP